MYILISVQQYVVIKNPNKNPTPWKKVNDEYMTSVLKTIPYKAKILNKNNSIK